MERYKLLSAMRMPATGVSFDEIPVIEVNRENIDRLWPHLILSIRKATLIALDLVSKRSLLSNNHVSLMFYTKEQFTS